VPPEGPEADKYRTIRKVKDGRVYETIAGAMPQVRNVERCGWITSQWVDKTSQKMAARFTPPLSSKERKRSP